MSTRSTEADADARSAPAPVDGWVATAWLVSCAVLVYLAMRTWWVAEDAFITFRYARNLVNGYGLRFNPSDAQPVEGYSDFLWLLADAPFEWLGAPPGVGVNALSIGCGLATLGLVVQVARSHLDLGRVATTVSLLTLATFAPMVTWATSGLEPMPVTLAFSAAAFLLAFDDRRGALATAVVAGLALTLLRTEGIAWIPVIAVGAVLVRWWEGRPVARPVLTFLAVVGLVWGAYFLWRWTVFGTVFSNTTQAKLGDGPPFEMILNRGLRYVGVSIAALGLPLTLLPAALLLPWHERRARAAWVLALAAAFPAWSALVGGDYMPFFRFIVPSSPALVLGVGLVIERIQRTLGAPASLPLSLAAVVLSILPTAGVATAPESLLLNIAFVEGNVRYKNGTFHPGQEGERNFDREWKLLRQLAAPGDRVVLVAIGHNGYYTDVEVIDQCRLVATYPGIDTTTSGLGGRRAGHDSCLPATRFLSLQPDLVGFQSFHVDARGGRKEIRSRSARMARAYPRNYYPVAAQIPTADGGGDVAIAMRRSPDSRAVAMVERIRARPRNNAR